MKNKVVESLAKKYQMSIVDTLNSEPDPNTIMVVMLPYDKLCALALLDKEFFNGVGQDKNSDGFRRFEQWVAEQNYEINMKENHPAVREAYHNFRVLLELYKPSVNE